MCLVYKVMKVDFRLLFIMGIALLLGGQSLLGQSKKELKEQKALEVKELINSGRYTIEVDRAIPMNGKQVNLTSMYNLELRGDSAVSYLPYFGRAYTAPYGGGNGLRFDESIKDLELSYDKKGTAKVKFSVRTSEDNYTFNVQVFSNASAIINVTPVNKQGITFYGDLILKK